MGKDDSRWAGKSGDAVGHTASRSLRWAARCGFVAEGVVYLLIGGLALHGVLVGDAVWRVLGLGAYADNGRAQAHTAALVMQLPFGRWAVAIVGVGITAFGAFQFYSAVTPSRDRGADPNIKKRSGLVIALRVLGFLARGVVFGLIGVFLVHAAWRHDASHATGIAGALTALQRQPYGSWLLGTVAAGLMAYGVAQIADVRWREIRAG